MVLLSCREVVCLDKLVAIGVLVGMLALVIALFAVGSVPSDLSELDGIVYGDYDDLDRVSVGVVDDNYGFATEYEYVNQEYAVCAHNDSLESDLSAFSLEYWFYPTTVDGDYWSYHLGYRDDVAFQVVHAYFGITLKITTIYNTTMYVGNTSFDETVESNGVGYWYHVVNIYNGTGMQIWVDGVLMAQRNDNIIGSLTDTALGFYFNRDTHWNRYGNSSLDEVRFYDRAINQTEIVYSYNSGAGRISPLNETGLIAWWHMDEGLGTTFEDCVGGNTATLQNDVEWVTGHVLVGSGYSSVVSVEDLPSGYEVALYDWSDNLLVCDATSIGAIYTNLTLPVGYRSSTFGGYFVVSNSSSVDLCVDYYTDIAGGDIYLLHRYVIFDE